MKKIADPKDARETEAKKKAKSFKDKKKNMQRLGGRGGLSLEAFAKAKTKSNTYNPAIIKKQRKFYKNAKNVSKYKRMLKQQGEHFLEPSGARQQEEPEFLTAVIEHATSLSDSLSVEVPPTSHVSPPKDIAEKPASLDFTKLVARDMIRGSVLKFLNLLWSDIQDKLRRTPLEHISSCREGIMILIASMKAVDKEIEFSHLEALLESYFDKTASLDSANFSLADQLSQELITQRRQELEGEIAETLAAETSASAAIRSSRGQLTKLRKRVAEQEALVKVNEDSRLTFQSRASTFNDKLAALKEKPSPSEDNLRKTDSLIAELRAFHDELLDLKPFA